MKKFLFGLLLLFITACVKIPQGIEPVTGFELDRYLGTWYEIARLDHSFERGLSNVTAQYSMRSDGSVKVINRGYSRKDDEWEEAEGRAYFVESPDTGFLKVSFFGPFYGSYIIFDLDHENYRYSYVTGPDRDYLWLLSRTPGLDEKIKSEFVSKAKTLGFNTDKLIFVKHDQNARPAN